MQLTPFEIKFLIFAFGFLAFSSLFKWGVDLWVKVHFKKH